MVENQMKDTPLQGSNTSFMRRHSLDTSLFKKRITSGLKEPLRRSSSELPPLKSRETVRTSWDPKSTVTFLEMRSNGPLKAGVRRHSLLCISNSKRTVANPSLLPALSRHYSLESHDDLSEKLVKLKISKMEEEKEKRNSLQQNKEEEKFLMAHRRGSTMPSIDEIIPSLKLSHRGVPLNGERRILQRRNSAYRILKFLADVRDSLTTETKLQIEEIKSRGKTWS